MAYQGYPGGGGGYPNQSGGYPTQGGGGGYPGYNPGQPAGGYPGYQPQAAAGYAPPPASTPGIPPDVERMFNAVDTDHSGKITAKELQAALQNGKGQGFSDKCCQLMISMFDRENSGTCDIHSFGKLFEYINQWLNIFKTYDRNGSGQIDDQELNQAFSQMGFNFSPQFTKQLTGKSHNHTEVSIDEFIVLCVTVQRLTEAFRVRDTQQNGVISIGFEDFLSLVLTNTN